MKPLRYFTHTPPIATGTVRSRKEAFHIRELFFINVVSSENVFYLSGQPVLYDILVRADTHNTGLWCQLL